MDVEYTDRYGGNPPSWLRGCHGDCEATGWTPVYMAEFDRGDCQLVEDSHPLGELEIKAWLKAHIEDEDHICNGYHFLPCFSCKGTGRVSWITTISRVPRWLVRGIQFAPFALRKEISPPDWTFRQRFSNYFNAAFMSDIKSLRR